MADVVEPIDAEDAKALIDDGEAVVDRRARAGRDRWRPARCRARSTSRSPSSWRRPIRARPITSRRCSPNKTVILYCASGKRSEFAGNKLVELGYREVFNLGGFKDWELAGLPVDEATE